MRPDELIGGMLRDDDAVILFDRRGDVDQQARSIGYELQECVDMQSPMGGANVKVALLRPAADCAITDKATLPGGARRGQTKFVRLMDRFFIPAAGDPVVSALFFNLIAERYEELTAADVNSQTALLLLEAVLASCPKGQTSKVLDFGCGTGFAQSAVDALGRQGHGVELIGTDLSEAMLSIARARGEAVIKLSDWRAMPSETFDAAISCFVLHYGVPPDDLARIGQQLKPGGVFGANLFKSDRTKLNRLTELMASAGLDLTYSEQSRVTPDTYNLHLLFRKRDGGAS